MYEVRGRPLLRCVLAPFADGVVFTLCLGAAFLLNVGGWVAVCAATFLGVYEARSYAVRLRADSAGLVVTNRFIRHRIPWRDIRGIWAPGPDAYEFVPTVRVERRHSVWFSISLYATLGMSREQRQKVALDLVELARQSGYRIVGGSEAEVEAQLETERTADPTSQSSGP